MHPKLTTSPKLDVSPSAAASKLATLFALALVACSSAPAPAPATKTTRAPTGMRILSAAPPEVVAETATAPAPAQTTHAPVDLRMSASLRKGLSQLTLQLSPQVDVPNALARIVLPPGVTLVSGAVERELGPLGAGAKASHAITVHVPATGSYRVAGGVEVSLSDARTLARSVVVELGDNAVSAP